MFNFSPKKFKKFHKVSIKNKKNVIYRQSPQPGSILIKSVDCFDFTTDQISTCSTIITRILKAENKRVGTSSTVSWDYSGTVAQPKVSAGNYSYFTMPFFPDFTDTSKPKETRMGKGKGAVSMHFFPVKKGKILFIFVNTSKHLVSTCLKKIQPKVPAKLKLVKADY